MSPLQSVDFKHPLFPAMTLPAAESKCLQLCFRPGLRLLERRGRTGYRQGSLGLGVMWGASSLLPPVHGLVPLQFRSLLYPRVLRGCLSRAGSGAGPLGLCCGAGCLVWAGPPGVGGCSLRPVTQLVTALN